MPALKCTCPECNLTFDATEAGGAITCPICDTEFAAPTSVQADTLRRAAPAPTPLPAPTPPPPTTVRRASRVRSEPVDSPAEKKSLAAKLVAAGAILFLACGMVMGYFVVNTLRDKARQEQAANELPPAVYTPPASGTAKDNVPAPRERPTPPPRPLTEDERKVNAAIERGVAFLEVHLDEILKDNFEFRESWQQDGVVALVGLTLLECGVPEKSPLIQRAARHLRGNVAKFSKTYVLALAILFFDRLGEERDRGIIQTCALRLVAGQKSSGCWHYDCVTLSNDEEKQLIDFMRSVMYVDPDVSKLSNAGNTLPSKLRNMAVPRWQRGERLGERGGDNSNTQFAVLGLWVAQRHGLPMQPALTLVDRYFRRMQNKDGSFAYVSGFQWRDSMTCAGLVGLAAGRGVGLEGGDGQKRDPAIEKAFTYLTPRIGTNRPRKDKKFVDAESYGDLYYLWSLERVAMIFDLDTIGGKDWYAWASKLIVDNQLKNGSWQETWPAAVDTSFALLVLKRVNVAKDLTNNIKKFVDIKSIR
ncbi:MAG: hypothetical protein AB7K24_33000 [Gemmataceae bacterium]